jgi:trimeric autotransporter adhesin
MKRGCPLYTLMLMLTSLFSLPALGQITPSDDAYTLTSSPTKNFGTATTLEVENSGAATFLRFNLSGIPSSVTGSMVAKGTLKIFVGTVTTSGSFNVDLVTSSWAEGTITADNAPSLGSAIASAIPVATANKNDYILVDVTAAVADWLNGTANDGLALVPDGAVSFTLNSKETTTTSHPAELDIVLTGPQGPAGPAGPISGVTAGPGLTGGGTKGAVKVSMLTSCAKNQVLQWNGSTWVCSSAGTGTITGVTAGTDLTGGGTGGTVTLNVDTTKIPGLGTANDFTAPQEFLANTGIGVAPSGNGYTPLTVSGATSFGTWLALANTSAGGHTWNIISAGSGNAEGAGNLGITDLTGKSTIWLEGNTNTGNLSATGNLGGATLVVTSTAGASIIDADGFGKNAGGPTPGLRFGGGGSGEGIASNRVLGLTRFGLDFYTNYTARMSILQSGQVAMGTATPGAQLGVVASSNAYPAIYGQAGTAANGSGQNGSAGIETYGGSADLSNSSTSGGDGIDGYGGTGSEFGGSGGVFSGATNGGGAPGDGVVGFSGGPTTDFGPFAGSFDGDIFVNGGISNESVRITIDHPLDPANKYLVHSSVQSAEMKNIYDGNVTTDANGEATVELPEWFESLNRDFRYQLTAIGQFAQAIIGSEINNHQFTIRTDKPSVKVSWQVTGIRQDVYAKAHPMAVEVAKNARERGHYLHPELYGAPEESSIEWARHPQLMKRLRDARKKQALSLPATGQASNQPR